MSRLESDLRGPAPRRMVRVVLGAAVVTALLVAIPGTAAAVPPPPPNPSDSQLSSAAADASNKAGEVAGLINRLSAAQSALDQLNSQVALKKELANKARVDLGTAQQAAAAAATAQDAAQRQVTTAEQQIDQARHQVDEFAAGSYQQGSTVGSFSAYVGSVSPEDVLDRAQLLSAVSSSQLGVMDTLQRARTQSANAASQARAAKQRADEANGRAEQAKQSADGATQVAVSAQRTQLAQSQQLRLNRNMAQYALDQARGAAAGLQGQRQAFEQWDAQRRAEEAAAARAAAEEAARAQAAAQAAIRQEQADAQARAQARAQAQAEAQAQAVQQERAQAQAPAQAETPKAPEQRAPAPAQAPEQRAPAPAQAPEQRAPAPSPRYTPPPAAPAYTPPVSAAYTPPVSAAPAAVASDDDDEDGDNQATGGVETVVNRALSRLGDRYSWGGGNYSGPTIGVRDGGVADSYGDYYSVGFDCSGLMMYAFAGAGVKLPHFSGYQYTSGQHIPLSQMQRGDMIFYGDGGSEHVALYLGNGKMVEAPESGEVVKISPVRYGGIAPYVTRML